ncbi:OB-fold-containig protein [Pacificoceanicola onchidii]|uniref:OB-fold-containig protein n=1 Tax=Pacificoceanicola onchidii TaxID=2562685 RepID=UPI0010A6A4FE|nr:OB-fold-containig protein [Pacificoceanicola onchidii]
MFELYLTGPYVPFTVALALLFGLLALELVFAILGGTLLGAGGDGPDFDVDGPDMDIGDLDIDFDALDVDAGDFELPDLDIDPEIETPDGAAATGGIAAWLGFGKMPALIWLASILLAFGATGLVIQSIVTLVLGTAVPALIAAVPAGIIAILFARHFGALFARLLPKTETQSLSERHLGRRPGTVTQGTAARGKPAEVRVTDRYGNTHYLRAEPLRDDAQISQGSEVLVLRHKRDGGYRIIPLNQ